MITIKNIFIAASIGVYSFANAQQRIYLNDEWENTTKDKAVYYRETTPQGKATLIKDYYINGVLQMEGVALDTTLNAEVFDGKVTWYFPSGKVNNFATFKNGLKKGPAKSFNEDGELTEDMVYTDDEHYSGKYYSFKNPDYAIDFNSISEYKDSQLVKVIVYDEDIKGIRYETNYVGYDSNNKYYDEKGRLIGGGSKEVAVSYYYNPMQIAAISKYDKDQVEIENTIYSRSKKVLQEVKKGKKDGYKRTFNEQGVKIGDLTYKYDKDYESLIPYSGDDYEFSYDYAFIESVQSYKEGHIIGNKNFNANGTLRREAFMTNEINDKIVYYDDNGKEKGQLILKDGEAYEGLYFEDDKEQKYSKGELVYSKLFFEDGTLMSEKKWNTAKNIYETNNFDRDKKLTFTYVNRSNAHDYFTADIVQYNNGKVINKATVSEGIISMGKIKFNTFAGFKEFERSGKWIILKEYDQEGKLTKENKVLYNEELEGIDYSYYISEEDLLNYIVE